jgi:hypothetical protein
VAESARSRLALLAEASSELAISLDVDETLQRLADLVVPALADWVVIHRADEAGQLQLSPIVRDGGGRRDLVREYAVLVPDAMTADSPVRELGRGRPSFLVAEFDPREAEVWTVGREIRQLRAALGIASTTFVALPGRDRMVGSMVLNRGASRPRFTDDDLQVAIDLGRRAGFTVDSARLYQNDHRIAETLQRSLLPELPKIDGLDIAARYRASATCADFFAPWPGIPHRPPTASPAPCSIGSTTWCKDSAWCRWRSGQWNDEPAPRTSSRDRRCSRSPTDSSNGAVKISTKDSSDCGCWSKAHRWAKVPTSSANS